MKYCRVCRSSVNERSYHCGRCNRCTDGFDHHCLYLGSCIGKGNYEVFIRILLCFIFHLLSLIAQAAWVFHEIEENGEANLESLSRWGLIPIIIISSLTLIAVLVLYVFHIYISCCVDLTTVEFISSGSTSSFAKSEGLEENVEESPNKLGSIPQF